MTLEQIIKDYGQGKGEKTMWAVTSILSDHIDRTLTDDDKSRLCKRVYRLLAGGHYNKEFADAQMAAMYYSDKDGKHYGPYWTEGEAKAIYEASRSKVPQGYNFYDFEVALNMMKSDCWPLLCKWHDALAADQPCGQWCDGKVSELAVNWLDDPDNPYGEEKVWGYFNGKD